MKLFVKLFEKIFLVHNGSSWYDILLKAGLSYGYLHNYTNFCIFFHNYLFLVVIN